MQRITKLYDYESKEQQNGSLEDVNLKQRSGQSGGSAQGSQKRGLHHHAGHSEPRPQTAEGGKGSKHERQIRVCPAQRNDV